MQVHRTKTWLLLSVFVLLLRFWLDLLWSRDRLPQRIKRRITPLYLYILLSICPKFKDRQVFLKLKQLYFLSVNVCSRLQIVQTLIREGQRLICHSAYFHVRFVNKLNHSFFYIRERNHCLTDLCTLRLRNSYWLFSLFLLIFLSPFA